MVGWQYEWSVGNRCHLQKQQQPCLMVAESNANVTSQSQWHIGMRPISVWSVWDDTEEGPQASIPNNDPRPRSKGMCSPAFSPWSPSPPFELQLFCHLYICSPVKVQNAPHVMLDKTLLPHCIMHLDCYEVHWIGFMNERLVGSGRYWWPPLPKCQIPSQRRFLTAWVGGRHCQLFARECMGPARSSWFPGIVWCNRTASLELQLAGMGF